MTGQLYLDGLGDGIYFRLTHTQTTPPPRARTCTRNKIHGPTPPKVTPGKSFPVTGGLPSTWSL